MKIQKIYSIEFDTMTLPLAWSTKLTADVCMVWVIDIEVSRLAIGFQKVCIIRLPQCTITTLNFASRIAHLLAAYYSNNIFTSLVKPTS